MKKICALTISFFSILLFFSGCNYAEHSENIKYVSATFNVLGSESENRLTKDELAYTKMNIQPKETADIWGLSFKAKLKEDTAGDEVSFLLNVYAGSETAVAEGKAISLKREFEVRITKDESAIEVSFDSIYKFSTDVLLSDKLPEEITVEFLSPNKCRNKDICFSLNDISLLTNKE